MSLTPPPLQPGQSDRSHPNDASAVEVPVDPADRVARSELLDIVRVLPDVIFKCEKRADGKIYWLLNEGRLAEEFGLTTKQIEGKHLEELFPGGASEAIKEHFEAAFRGETKEWTNEMGGRYFKHHPQPIFDEQGNVTAVVGFITEVTGLTLAKKELEETSKELEQSVHDLQQANQDLRTLNHTLSHDMKGPLTVVTTQLELLKRRLNTEGLPEAAQGKQVEAIKRATFRMDQMIEDIVRYSRVGLVSLNPEEVDFTTLSREIAHQLENGEPGRRVKLQVAPGLKGRMDPALARALLDNLVGNAWKYTRDRDPAVIEVDAIDQEDGTWLRVKDNGIGFADEEVERVFEPFTRLEGAMGYTGTGVGLATVRRIAERHGGRVEAHGKPGQGSEFRVRLPTSA
jgi:PAS domain S-box-containing protein